MRLRDLSIEQKLTALILVITTVALLVAGAGVVTADSILFRGYLERDLTTFATVIADNSIAALAFDDPRSASDVLYALRARTHIIGACLYQNDGQAFARYVRAGAEYNCPTNPRQDGIRETPAALVISRSVMLGTRRVGHLLIAYDLGERLERMRIYGWMVLLVLIVSSVLALIVSSRLRATFVKPILDLAATSAEVTRTRDYSVRAAESTGDEIGALASSFNAMLAGIESRDGELRKTLAGREEALRRLAVVNRDLRRSNERLERSNQDLERFAFIASHDMQEPLRMVTIYAQLLVKECGAGNPELAVYRDYIVRGARQMRQLISDLLEYIEVTTAPRKLAPVDLNSALAKVKENLRMAIEECGANLIHSELPAIQAQEADMVSLFQNLIGNSLKYRGPDTPRVEICWNQVDGHYQFSVADNGVGIAPEYHQNVFLAFKRLHRQDIPGTGIGLAICRRIVERYGGRIWVESEAGRGATFHFTLPISQSQEGDTNEQTRSAG